MAALTTDVKVLIIQLLACYETPSQVADRVQKDFGIVVTPQRISAYNPHNTMGKNLSAKWVNMFNEVRARFNTEAGNIPIASKAHRLRMLDRMARRNEEMGNFSTTAKILKQAAKEVGDA